MAHVHTSSCGCGPAIGRRGFLGSVGCGAYVMWALASGAFDAKRAFAAPVQGEEVMKEDFARVEKLADGVWAVIGTPQGGRQVFSNAGIIAGSRVTMVIEGQNTPEGAAWVSEIAQQLTGRRPLWVVLTHYHADHSGGLSGHLGGKIMPQIIATETTRRLMIERYSAGPTEEQAKGARDQNIPTVIMPRIVLPDTVMVECDKPMPIDLGGRTAMVHCRSGHTPSDLTIEVSDPRVVWCGDLVFNGLFPFYGDAIPSQLSKTCKAMLTDPETTYVPGHGSVATAAGLKTYLGLLDDVEAAARKAIEAGTPASAAWQQYEVPKSLGEWSKFRADVYRFAFEAWERELKKG